MWTPATRRQHGREHLRYKTDLMDQEWKLIAPIMPAAAKTGRPRRWPLREIMNAIFYVMRGGIGWRLLLSNIPPRSTVFRWLCRFCDECLFEKINGRKRHALVDTDGRALVLFPHPASIQDRDGASQLLQASRRPFPFIREVFADAGYQGPRVAETTSIAVEIVKRKPHQVSFAVHPKRWVIDRFFA